MAKSEHSMILRKVPLPLNMMARPFKHRFSLTDFLNHCTGQNRQRAIKFFHELQQFISSDIGTADQLEFLEAAINEIFYIYCIRGDWLILGLVAAEQKRGTYETVNLDLQRLWEGITGTTIHDPVFRQRIGFSWPLLARDFCGEGTTGAVRDEERRRRRAALAGETRSGCGSVHPSNTGQTMKPGSHRNNH